MKKFSDMVCGIVSVLGMVVIAAICICMVVLCFAGEKEATKNDTENLFDIPAQTYVCTDPDTDVQYIVVVGNNDVAICRREPE